MARLRPSLQELHRLATPLNEVELRVAYKPAELDDSWTVYVQPRLAQDIVSNSLRDVEARSVRRRLGSGL